MDIRARFGASAAVDPPAITGTEDVAELLEAAFPAFVGRQLRTAWELMDRCASQGHTVFLTLSGAMTPAGLHASSLIPLLERGLVHSLTTTGANLYHDAHRVIGHTLREVDPQGGDPAYRSQRIVRIYDLGFDEQVLLDTDELFARLLSHPEVQRPVTTWELHAHLGKQLAELEAELGVRRPSLLSTCWRHGVPIFCGAPQDGSIFLNAVKLRALHGQSFGFSVDTLADVYDMAALQWLTQTEGPTAVWILGGGVPKNYTLQGEPTLSQILGIDARGFDVDVQICVDTVDNGALSSCPAGEGHTWGKTTAECAVSSSVYVHADVTATVPWLTHALLARHPQRAPRRLLDRMSEARRLLDAALAQQH